MSHTRSRRRRRHQALCTETPSTVAVLTTETDFTAMRGYRSFAFDDYAAYLQQVQALLRHLSGQGLHTRVAPFDPDRFAAYCLRDGLDPDAPVSRTRYTAEIAGTGLTVPYDGQPCDDLLPLLRAWRARDAVWDEADRVLDTLGGGEASLHTAAEALDSLLTALGAGTHHLVCSVDTPRAPLLAVLHTDTAADGTWELAESDVLLFCSVLAAGLATGSPGGLVTRTTSPACRGDRPSETVRGWCLHRGWLAPLTEAQVFSAYCTHAETGEPVPPEPGVTYAAGVPLSRTAPGGA
ncbi:hypothetical protein E4198_00730 [Streptomyces sp. RKND-216]|uniref:hypothetical protein n=1 Tax=Streptomyces sp. RKND-216 TaxID=2562581 RepID=UPI00109E1CA8|nr:hypothetical protein [Streptomyces sp. RKND-216]THA23458.1 hypothetical protein E4198_00730 [Streptomyces sp. RKND-216]